MKASQFLPLLLSLAVTHSATADPATSDERLAEQMKHGKKRVSTMVPWGIPTVMWQTCSAGLARSKALNDQVIAVTGRHCIHRKDYGSTGFENPHNLPPDGQDCRPHPFTTYASGSIQGLFLPRKGFAFDLNKSDISENQDLVVTGVSESSASVGDALVLTMADDLPQPGSPVHFWGYPQYGVPLIGNFTHQTRYDCIYRGPVLIESPQGSSHPTSLFQLAECPHEIFVDGMSGGPVTDEHGQFIGSLNGAYNPEVNFGPRENRKTMLIFTAITNREISERKAMSAQNPGGATPYRVFPHLDGRKQVPGVFTITSGYETLDPIVMGPELMGRLHQATFDIPFKNDVVDGELTVFNSSGQVDHVEIWSNGKFVKRK